LSGPKRRGRGSVATSEIRMSPTLTLRVLVLGAAIFGGGILVGWLIWGP
jgi:hypothetical protein